MSSTALDLTAERWTGLLGGYRIPYDPRKALRLLERSENMAGAWDELWNELHHQGDVGDASFAAVPHLVRIHERRGFPDWNTYALAATIELARDSADNPPLPSDLRDFYQSAWICLPDIGLRELSTAKDSILVASIIGVLAIAKGQRTLGRLAIEFTEDERLDLLTKYA
ncbi:MAG TPA: hypothetical protein VKQ73_03280 [Stellaceae bacterium]|nr:hypothetical protein [Stellaceae bacterium]